jgi:hypothetical protein
VKSKQEIENMRRKCDNVRAFNLELKAKVIIIIIFFSELDLFSFLKKNYN